MTASSQIVRILDFAQQKLLICAEDRAYAYNRLLEMMQMDAPDEACPVNNEPLTETMTDALEKLMDIAVEKGILRDSRESRDLFATRLYSAVTPSPFETREHFASLMRISPKAATAWFYNMCRDTDYIKVDRINKNARYFAEGLEITINLSKPEKDPRVIALALTKKNADYPKCMLCLENPGYAGRIGFPARQNHRVIPLSLAGEAWHMQYSPYLYYNEHCIVFCDEHRPMKISREGFRRMFSFVNQFPHYFIGSNADLPIVGGSILTHDHFQGGNYVFPMDKAKDEIPLTCAKEGIKAAIIDWPLSCLRLKGKDEAVLTDLADSLLAAWRAYTDEENEILAYTDQPHNTITPILRRENDEYALNLVLRNNRTTNEHKLGLFHPHAEKHHIKRENIGLIEVMGLMILPGRLLKEMDGVKEYLTGKREISNIPAEGDALFCHYEWAKQLVSENGCANSPEKADEIVREGIAKVCRGVLSDAGVFKQTEKGRAGFVRFLESTKLFRK